MREREDQQPDEILRENAQAIENLRELTNDLEAVLEHERWLTDDSGSV